ncbi:MAG: FHA domain-containing protein [Oryzihumus sp.]|uniref:Type III secretion system (T3SS) inner membrane Yop/YscD-like protein n=1 Tax=Oryzihumus leptocrescens TaxID=297536 RepID=A0A542ZJ97_9MICO|nr:FHA domain-containing protein [Oryzihumus leptocrescens]TQL60358.1 type III secretion system (T3SS) inner membrane Yop/YscD-like protein [Oryzihumus leptocrescens]
MTDSEQERPIRSGEPTTMRFPGIGDLEHVEGAPEEGGLTAADQATVDALREGTALLVVLRGPNTGARFLLDADEVSSGRHPDSDIFLDDVTVSRKHATFRREGGSFIVRDVGSLNGTYVNRQRIDEVVLHTGDEVQIGKFRLVFYAGSGASSA